ncbi:MAG: hypothetical protein SV760_04830 [Halobacteria archaeon]|nr:hypothetical protein [Halobacteria archaeon]
MTDDRPEVVGIASDTLDFVFEASQDAYPDSFVGYLQTTEARDLKFGDGGGYADKDRVITEVVMTPKSREGDVFSVLGIDALPRRTPIVGTVASHPDGSLEPDDEDFRRFDERGVYHLIVTRQPDGDDGKRRWRCYDPDGNERELRVVDVEFDDEDDDGWMPF